MLDCLRHAWFLWVHGPVGRERDLAGSMWKWWALLHLNSMSIHITSTGSAPWMLKHFGALEDWLPIVGDVRLRDGAILWS